MQNKNSPLWRAHSNERKLQRLKCTDSIFEINYMFESLDSSRGKPLLFYSQSLQFNPNNYLVQIFFKVANN
jgi:hypothetical protein